MSQETVYAIASGKGGVGKTTTTVNLGTALAGVGNRVVIVDVDLGMANLAGFVSLDADGTSLHDVLGGTATVEQATYELANGIWAIPSGVELSGYADVATEELTSVVADLRERFDYVLLDVGAGVSHETVLPLGLADATLLVSTTEPAAVQDAKKTVDLVGRAGGSVGGVVVTRTRPEDPVSPEDVTEQIGSELLVAVPEDPKVRESVHAGTPLVVHEPKSPAARAYRYLAARLLGQADDDDHPRFGAKADDGGESTPADADASADDAVDASDAASADDVSSAISEVDGDDGVDIPDAEADYEPENADDDRVESALAERIATSSDAATDGGRPDDA
ncbi:P-loop NTPase [Halorubellus sp. JP-L1]|uniref:cell division ATPase MinD n=1 Tax=Halorubellus sp. JP-L1 TaxID=2715753 RepID=UPI00140CFB40|nr:cell division ATPase MinD [Halorubellus sp. JP-L1]NHN41811.1 P-loop NTPase [Halorubellus sp. JP-L1]